MVLRSRSQPFAVVFLKPIPTFTRFSFLPGDFLCVLLPRRSHMHALRLETTLGEIIKVCLANKWRAHLQRCLHVSLVWTSKVQLILRFNLFSSTANRLNICRPSKVEMITGRIDRKLTLFSVDIFFETKAASVLVFSLILKQEKKSDSTVRKLWLSSSSNVWLNLSLKLTFEVRFARVTHMQSWKYSFWNER